MARNHAVRRRSLAILVFLVGTASGALLTLSNFDGLVSSAPIQCLYAYNTPIRGCTPSDFVGDATCSESCIEGLQAVQFTVRSLCANVDAASNPVLKQIQAGNILDFLCKTDTLQISTASTPVSHSATTLKTSTKQTPPPSPSSSKPQSTTNRASHFTTTNFSTLTEAATSALTFPTPDLSTAPAVVPSLTSESTNETTVAPTSQTMNGEQASSSREEPSKPTRPPNTQPGSGGGSPFDFVAVSTAVTFKLSGASITTVMAIALTALTLR
ncbi:hypothetical protein V8C37DRAFT_218922 [Trichoderma ceciliae]